MTQRRIETRRVTDAERARMSALSKHSEREETGEAVKPLPENKAEMSAADLAKFPLEHARLRSLPICEYPLLLPFHCVQSDVHFDADCLIEWVPVIIFGWLVQHRVNLAAPLVLLFFGEYSLAENSPFFERNLIIHVTIVGYGQIGMSQACQVLLLDLYPGNGASIIANVCDVFIHLSVHHLDVYPRSILFYQNNLVCRWDGISEDSSYL